MAIEHEWVHSLAEIPEAGLETRRSATAAAREKLASDLDLISCDRLDAHYAVSRLSQGRYLLQGTLEADITQTCVVTLDPVETHIVEPFEVEFRPESQGTAGVAEFDALETRDIEPLEGETIPVGRIVYEQLASAIPAYPRKEGATFEPPASEAHETKAASNPFAVLKNLKRKE